MCLHSPLATTSAHRASCLSPQRRNKYQDTRLQALRARNDFLLCLEAANTTMQRFFVDDLPDTLDCADAGVHAALGRALLMACDAQEGVLAGERQAVDDLRRAVSQLDARLDKQRFIEANNAPFMLPKKFDFIPYKGDIVSGVRWVDQRISIHDRCFRPLDEDAYSLFMYFLIQRGSITNISMTNIFSDLWFRPYTLLSLT